MWKEDPSFYSLQETLLNTKDRHYFKVKCLKKIFQANEPKKQAGTTILLSIKIDFEQKLIEKDRKRHCIHIKGKIQQDNVSILNIYASKDHPSL